MSNMLVSSLCDNFNKLECCSIELKESIPTIYFTCLLSEEIKSILIDICSLTEGKNLDKFFTVNIDDYPVALKDIIDHLNTDQDAAELQFTFKKKDFAQEEFSGAGDIDEILFTSVAKFQDKMGALGLDNPFLESPINNLKHTRIRVHGLLEPFGGPKLAVVPIDFDFSDTTWMKQSRLPTKDDIQKRVHIVSNPTVSISPQDFELNWGSIECAQAALFRQSFGQQLLTCMSEVFYSLDKIQLKGIKHIDAKIDNVDTKPCNKWIETVNEMVCWCYGHDDPKISIQLVVDRLSLDCTSESLLSLSEKIFRNAYEQAKDNYRYVIAEKSVEYRKELKAIYSDIKEVTDKYSEKSLSLASELLKTLLTIGFIFTVGTVSKAIVNEELLHSKEGLLLFKIIAVYLTFSFVFRWLHASADLKISKSALESWSSSLHNYISSKDIETLITKNIFWSRFFYLVILAIVEIVQLTIALFAYHADKSLKLIGL